MPDWVLIGGIGASYVALQLVTLGWPDGPWRTAAEMPHIAMAGALAALAVGILLGSADAALALAIAVPLASVYLWALAAVRLAHRGYVGDRSGD